jgi:hypothetical protein
MSSNPLNESNPIKRCGAKTRSGKTCCKFPVAGRERCRLHGGATPVGVASPHFKTGRHSKYIPERLAERYQEALADGELLALREEIALVDARLADLLGRVDTGESGLFWRQARAALNGYNKAVAEKKDVEAATYLFELRQIIDKGIEDYSAWAEVHAVLEQRRRLVESETKRLSQMQQFITAEKAMALIASLTDIIKRHVTDRAALAGISADLIRLTAEGSSRVVDG